MKKHSFTLAETLVTLTILGIIMAIVMPLINKAKPDKDIIIFKKGLYTIQSAVGNATEVLINQGALSNEIWKDDLPDGTQVYFCERLADHLNTAIENCYDGTGTKTQASSSYDDPQIVTTDGIRFWRIADDTLGDVGGPANRYNVICIERGLSAKEATTLSAVRGANWSNQFNGGGSSCGTTTINGNAINVGLKIKVRWDGKVYIPSETTDDSQYFNYEKELINKAFEVKKDD